MSSEEKSSTSCLWAASIVCSKKLYMNTTRHGFVNVGDDQRKASTGGFTFPGTVVGLVSIPTFGAASFGKPKIFEGFLKRKTCGLYASFLKRMSWLHWGFRMCLRALAF